MISPPPNMENRVEGNETECVEVVPDAVAALPKPDPKKDPLSQEMCLTNLYCSLAFQEHHSVFIKFVLMTILYSLLIPQASGLKMPTPVQNSTTSSHEHNLRQTKNELVGSGSVPCIPTSF